MKEFETKNSVRTLWRSQVLNELFDGETLRLLGASLLGIVVDFLVFEGLLALGIAVELSQIISFFAGAILIFRFNASAFPPADQVKESFRWALCGRILLVVFLTLLLRNGVFSLLTRDWQWQPYAAVLVAILIGTVILLAGAVLLVFPSVISWPVLTISMVIYLFLLKLVFMGYVNLIPEEAYYWNYAQRLDIGYLDHPPMVAWLIWLSTTLFGRSEVSVRLPAFVCWIAAAIFMFRLGHNIYGRRAAFGTVLFLAALPFYLGMGFFMTPDPPLLAAWAGCLYFLERALIGGKRRAWIWAGVCLGIGMLSKYTIALLGVGSLTFMLIDRQSRSWLFRSEPYIATLAAAVLFSPVILWNMQNDWASFVFQSSNRWSGSHEFALHLLLGACVLILTPLGLVGAVWLLLTKRSERISYQTDIRRRQYLWTVVFTLVPLSVFIVFSLLNKPKLNWTAPVWLAIIPLLAWDMANPSRDGKNWWAKCSRWFWMPTIIVLLFTYGLSFEFVTRGMPGVGLMTPGRLFGEWRQLAYKVAKIETTVEAETGTKPMTVGMDRNFIASELSFYNETPFNTGGPHFFGSRSLMWAIWAPRSAAVGRNLLLIDFDRKRITGSAFAQYFDRIGEVSQGTLENDGRVVGYFYWRVGYGYKGLPQSDSPENSPRAAAQQQGD